MNHCARGCVAGLLLAIVGVGQLEAGSITLRSGNGSIGDTDSLITMLIGPPGSVFPDPFTAGDFAAARSGLYARIIDNSTFLPPGFPTLPSDPTAQWISTDLRGGFPLEGRTALYAMDFVIAESIGAATLELLYAVDNYLGNGPDNGSFVGNGPNEGVYVNAMPIVGSSTNDPARQEYSLVRDITSLLHVGTNTLYLNQTDVGGPSGLVFKATISIAPIPEPSTLTLFALGTLTLVGYGWRRKRKRAA